MKTWKRLTQDEYIKKANVKHNNFYDYSDVVFTTVNNKINIICPKHGVFTQNAANHLNGNKCKKCAMEQRSVKRTRTTSDFITKAISVHQNKYNYTHTVYTKSCDKVVITCPMHGDFSQIANVHILGGGCPTCARLTPSNGWTFTEWETYGLKSKNFTGFSLYIIECWNNTERFLKVGKTFVPIEKRYDYNDLMPYSYKILQRIEGNARYISELELAIHSSYRPKKIIPDVHFKGGTECYPITLLEELQLFIKDFYGCSFDQPTPT